MFAVGPSIAFKRPAFVGRCFCGGLMWWYGDIAEWFPCRWFPISYLLSVVPYCNLYFHGLASIFENICALALFKHSKSSWCILSCISQDCQVSYEPQVAVFDDCNNVFLYSGTSIQNQQTSLVHSSGNVAHIIKNRWLVYCAMDIDYETTKYETSCDSGLEVWKT